MKNIKLNFLDIFLIFILLIYIANATFILEIKTFTIIIFLITFFLFLHKKKKFDKFVLWILVYWTIINLLSLYLNNINNIKIYTLISSYIRILIPYFIIKIINRNFFDKIFKVFFYISIISFSFYVIDLIYPNFFQKIIKNINFFTQQEEKLAGGWYIFFYMHNAWAYTQYITLKIFRNSGFMWEAGAYAMILILLLSYYLIKNNYKWDKIAVIIVIFIITTFSTAGYLALLFIFYAYLYKKNKKKLLSFFIILPIIIFITIQVYKIGFISQKINIYLNMIDYHYYHKFSGIERVNRFGVFKYYLEQTFHNPLGNGIYDSYYLLKKYFVIYKGPNTFAQILYRWGFGGFFIFLYSILKFYSFYTKNKIIIFLNFIALSIVLFSNPFLKFLVFSIIFFVYNEQKMSYLLKKE